MKLLAAATAVGALLFVSTASGDGEGPTLVVGDSAIVVGTRIGCLVSATSVRCGRTGGLRVTLTRAGEVTVVRGGAVPARARGHARLKLGVNGGFFVAATPIYCHVYVQGTKVMTCSLGTAKGGIPKSRGFDISDHAVLVFRYGMQDDRHPVRTYRIP